MEKMGNKKQKNILKVKVKIKKINEKRNNF